ncbi:hypothetical protein AB0C84_11935 [Actinomadura sp. NPDC048955]|uniref:DUF6928 family protein n=1 Tax=Actinomadura sp. NPDC048955 TaxID=3158228 RepID=UPI0033F86CA0
MPERPFVYTDGHPADLLRSAPEPDPAATAALISRTNPGWDGSTTSPGNLDDYINPDQGVAYAGSCASEGRFETKQAALKTGSRNACDAASGIFRDRPENRGWGGALKARAVPSGRKNHL